MKSEQIDSLESLFELIEKEALKRIEKMEKEKAGNNDFRIKNA
jgi:hypothetical protein